MAIFDEATCETIAGAYYLQDSPNEHEAKTASETFSRLRDKHGIKSNRDLQDVLAIAAAAQVRRSKAQEQARAAAPSAAAPASDAKINLIDALIDRIDRHVWIPPAEQLITALWILHTYVYDQFEHTPRMLLLSPTTGCGKTELMKLLKALTVNPHLVDDISAALAFRLLDNRWARPTMLVDQGENFDLLNNRTMKNVFDGGYGRDGSVGRAVGKGGHTYSTFAPFALAGISKRMIAPPSAMRRSHLIRMHRAPHNMKFERVNACVSDLEAIRGLIRQWAETVALAPDPEMPAALNHEEADRCRALVSIADAFGRGDEARAVAVEICGARPSDDASIILLWDVKGIRDKLGGEHASHKAIVAAMHELDDRDWNEWCGPDNTHAPRKFSTADLVVMLKPHGIMPKNIWSKRRKAGDKSERGYYWYQFEEAWKSYCSKGEAPKPSGKIISLAHG